MPIPGFLKRLVNPWSRVPPAHGFRFIPRIFGKVTEWKKVNEINERYPPYPHSTVADPFKERTYERSAGERLADKWKSKPYELTYSSHSDENKDPRPDSKDSITKQTGGYYGYSIKTHAPPEEWWEANQFPLHDYEFPIPAGRLILKWLYEVHEEPCNIQRRELPYDNIYADDITESWVSPAAILVGNVQLFENAWIADNCIVRGDRNRVIVGLSSAILEGCVVTTAPAANEDGTMTPFSGEVVIGKNTVVGPNSRLHACHVGDFVSIGSNCIIRYGARIGNESIIAAGSVVEEDQWIPDNEIWGGAPARFIRHAGDIDKSQNFAEAVEVASLKEVYRREQTSLGNVWSEQDQLCAELEDALRNHIKGKTQFTLPPSLQMTLIQGLSAEQHPNPPKTVADRLRELYKTDYDFNKFADQRPVYTGNYNHPQMEAQMS